MSERLEKEVPKYLQQALAINCGCGRPDAVWSTYLYYLQFAADTHVRWGGGPREGDPITEEDAELDDWRAGREWLPAYLLDHFGWTDHGGGVHYAWLTATGKEVLAFLQEYGSAWLEDGSAWYIVDDNGQRLYQS